MIEQRSGAVRQEESGRGQVYTALVQPRDPLLLRDARPFSADPGARAETLSWPLPRTFAGALRAWHFERRKDREHFLPEETIAVHGPLLAARAGDEWEVYLPAPLDVIPYREEVGNLAESNLQPGRELMGMILAPMRPEPGEGCDLPTAPPGWERRIDLHPLSVTEDVKPAGAPALWRLADLVGWLNEPRRTWPTLLEEHDGQQVVRGIDYPRKETRTHVAINTQTGTNRDGHLFATESLAFRDEPANHPATALLGRVSLPDNWTVQALTGPLPLGGERRVTTLTMTEAARDGLWPTQPVSPSIEQIERAGGICLYLATPAIFKHGWLPAWLKNGAFDGTGGQQLGLTLAGIVASRPVAVSGWKNAAPDGAPMSARSRRGAPNATRYAAPAGSIYFFTLNGEAELTEELCEDLWTRLWLQPVSDSPQDRAAGFGLALPGLWAWASDRHEGEK